MLHDTNVSPTSMMEIPILKDLGGLTVFLIIFLLTLVIVKIFKKLVNDLHSSPPGPWGFPVVGHLPLLGKNPSKTFMEMSKTYGDVFMIRMGSWPTLVLNSKEVIREALMDNSDVFSDRPEFFTAKTLNNMKSVSFGSYTQRWRLHRKIANNVLRKFASSKNNPTEDIINQEIETLVNGFMKNREAPFNPHDNIFLAVGCIIFQICFGSAKNCRQDTNFLQFIGNTKIFVETAGAGNPLDVMPWLQYMMPWKAKRFLHVVSLNSTLVDSELKTHIASFDDACHRDIADGLIAAAEQYGNSPEQNNGITKYEILSTLRDFMGAGFETVSTTLEWALLYISHYKEVQKKIQNEIKSVIGGRKPTLKDRGSLPYTEATILEVIRIANVVPMGLPHATTSDTVFRNYRIKKGTVVFCNTYATAKDSQIWKNPNDFYPERFLDNNNEINSEKADAVLTFGMGRRRCPGEFLAKKELFLFVVNIFQRCEIELCSQPNFEPIFGLTCKPQPYEIKVSEQR